MRRSIAAIVQDKQVLTTSLGTRIHLTFQTTTGHNVVIRAPIEDQYLASIEPLDRVYFQRDRQGCHHLQRRNQPVTIWLKSIFHRKRLHSIELLNRPI
jgi:hypothetical protein